MNKYEINVFLNETINNQFLVSLFASLLLCSYFQSSELSFRFTISLSYHEDHHILYFNMIFSLMVVLFSLFFEIVSTCWLFQGRSSWY